MYPIRTRKPPRMLPWMTNIPANSQSRRPDSNRGPLHYEFPAAVTTSLRQSLQVTPRAGSPRQEVTHADSR
jgi:hypothetical protein